MEQKGTSVRFATFASQTIAFETGGDKSGAYHLDPNDKGGETKWGISKRAHPSENIKALTYSDALRIYQSQYWNYLYDFINDDKLAFKLYDMGVVSGTKRAVTILQSTIRDMGLTVAVDGGFGPLTATAISLLDKEKLYNEYINNYSKFFKRISIFKNKRFLSGWLRRLNWKWGEEGNQW
jgi:lysozyme family protein